MNGRVLPWVVPLCLCIAAVQPAWSHPVPRDNHDRTLVVWLTPTAVVVDYRLEVDETRAALDLSGAELARVSSRAEFYQTFTRWAAPFLANNLVAHLDGRPLTFVCVGQRSEMLDHMRCDFRFRASWAPEPGKKHTFDFREGNYDLDDLSQLRLHLTSDSQITVQSADEPDEALMARPGEERKPGDGERLRRVSATFLVAPRADRGVYKPALSPPDEPPRSPPRRRRRSVTVSAVKPAPLPPVGARPAEPAAWGKAGPEERAATGPSAEPPGPRTLLQLLLDTRMGVGMLLLLAAGFGAAHALTPGHGKTMVAAYLVGERGTFRHAVVLGLATTLTHTAAVLVLATLLTFGFPNARPAAIQQGLEFLGGLVVGGLGAWLLLRRLAGQADHVHLGGGHHHHHGHVHLHEHGHQHHVTHDPPALGYTGPGGTAVARLEARPGWWEVVLLGMSGGVVPCWDAIALLCFPVSAERQWLTLPLVLAFSGGLAAVLVALGISVVHARNVAGRRWGQLERWRPLVRVLPLASAAVITALGLGLCYNSLHP